MSSRFAVTSALLCAQLAILAVAAAADLPKGAASPVPPKNAPPSGQPAKAALKPARSVPPLHAGQKAASSHAPFEAGDCSTCHEKEDPRAPGPLKMRGSALCHSCHEEFKEIAQRKFKHAPAEDGCTHCHNPHNSTEAKLLVAEQTAMCFDCHQDIQAIAASAKVKHAALTTGAKCANCHNPHGANVEKLLQELPMDLCTACHSKDGVSDGRGAYLTNFKKWLQTNNNWHAPVQQKDCSACHRVHGGENFRLLTAEYPKAFYSSFDPKNYALCFGCHNEQVTSEPETTTLTSFRDGSKNLHYLHVHKQRGRTCRACHEVHASQQEHHIREGVPYGPTGWILKLNFTKTATGGQCARTCHETKAYNNTVVTGLAPAAK